MRFFIKFIQKNFLTFILFITLINQNLYAHHQENKIINTLSESIALDLWNLNYEQIKIKTISYMKSEHIKAINIYDGLQKKYVFIASKDGNSIKYSTNIKSINKYKDKIYSNINRKIIYKNKKIGEITIFYLKSDSKVNLSEEEIIWIKNNPIINVLAEKNREPLSFVENKKITGYSNELISLLASNVGLKVNFISKENTKNYFEKLENNEVDLISGTLKTKVNKDFAIFTDFNIHNLTPTIYTNNSKYNLDSFDKLKKHSIVVVDGHFDINYLKTKYPQIDILVVKNSALAIDALLSNKVNALVDLPIVINNLIEKNKIKYIYLKNNTLFDSLDNFKEKIAIRKNAPILKSILNKSFEHLTKEKKKILTKKWFENRKANKKIYFTKDEIQYLKSKGTIKMCVMSGHLPYNTIDEKGEYIGIISDIVKIMQSRINIPITIFPTNSWNESLDSIKSGLCDMIPAIQKTKSRSKYINFTKPYLSSISVIATKNKELFVNNLDDILDKKVAIKRGFAYFEILKEKYPSLQIIEVDTIDEGLEKIKTGEIYGYIDSLPTLGYKLQKNSEYEIKIAGKIGFDLHLSVGTSKKEEKLNIIFSKIVNTLYTEEINKIYNKWISIKYEEKIDYDLIYKIIAIFLLLLIPTLLWLKKLKDEIRKREKIEAKLILARQEALNASKAKSEFLANMSHEIRTPINGIVGMSTLAIAKIDTDKNQAKEYIKKAQSSTKMLLGVINDILDFSKIEARKLEIENKAINLDEIVDQLNDLFDYMASQKDLNFIIEQDSFVPSQILGDKLRLSQVLNNLIGNAIKFTSKGEVKVKVELASKTKDDIELKFSILDTGKGIASNKQKNLFKSFSQEDSSISKEYGGTGLGLVISKSLVELMNGKIWFESKENEGSKFYFTIKTKLVKNKMKIVEKEESILNEILLNNDTVLDVNILLVEDNEINMHLAKDFLNEIVSNIETASNGEEALEKLLSKPADYYKLILMDVHMPIMDGYTCSRKIKELDKYKNIPIVAMTANVLKKDLDKCIESGMSDYIIKPYDVTELYEKVKYWLNFNSKSKTIKKNDSKVNNKKEKSFDPELAISRMLNRKDLYKDFIVNFLNTKTTEIDKIKEYLQSKNFNEIKMILHSLKGIAGTIGAQKLRFQLSNIEKFLKENNSIENELIEDLDKEMKKVIRKAQRWLNEN